MLPADQKPFAVLNNLVAVNTCRIEGYHFAARKTDASILRELFIRLKETSFQCKLELKNEIYKLGGKPAEEAVASPEFFKAWLELMTAIGKRDHKSVLSSCIYEEGVVLRQYEEAITADDGNITTQQHLLFTRQHNSLQGDNEKIKNLLEVLVKYR